jgi:hypothetical protein
VRAAVCLGWLCLAGVASATPTGLTNIPTADIVPLGQWTLQLQNGNTALQGPGSLFDRPEPYFQTQFGVIKSRAELGCDLVTLDSPGRYRPIMNLKVLPIEEGYDWPAVAIGVAQVGSGFDAFYYAVASRTLNYRQIQYQKFRAHHRNLKLRGIRLHAGVQGTLDDPRGLLGTDLEISAHLVCQADWISGHDHSASLGAVWVLDQLTTLQAALLRSNDAARIDGLEFTVTHQFNL